MTGWRGIMGANGKVLPMAAPTIGTADNPVKEQGMYVEPVVAYRCWLVDPDAPGLRSWTHDVPWKPNKELAATCKARALFSVQHPTPNVHGCGIYGVKTLDQANQWLEQQGRGILGVVKMWGRVIVCNHGYLAEFAYPAALLLPGKGIGEGVLDYMAGLYGVRSGWE